MENGPYAAISQVSIHVRIKTIYGMVLSRKSIN
jgi:hypothetical protein